MNEVLNIINLKFPRNLQIVSSIDTILIPLERNKDEPYIKLIDYKTGIEMKDITFTSKLQAMLMSISIFYNFIDKVDKIPNKLSVWDISHYPQKPIDLPHFNRRSLLDPSRFNKAIDIDRVYDDLSFIADRVHFIYINPITGEQRKVDYLPIARKALRYLTNLNEFYAENKSKIKQNKTFPFLTPQFVPEKVLNSEINNLSSSYQGTQIALF